MFYTLYVLYIYIYIYISVNYTNTVVYFCREVKHISTARYEVIINIAKDSSLLGRGMDGQGLVPGILKTHGIFIVKPIIFV